MQVDTKLFFTALVVAGATGYGLNIMFDKPTRPKRQYSELERLLQQLKQTRLPESNKNLSTIDGLVEAYGRTTPGPQRTALVERIAELHRPYVRSKGGGLKHFDFLDSIIRSTHVAVDERRFSVIALHRLSDQPVVDKLVEYARDSEFNEVRFAAAEGLAWVKQPSREIAVRALKDLVKSSPHPNIRGIAALSLAIGHREASASEVILERIKVEDDRVATQSLVSAFTKLDSKNARKRLVGILAACTPVAENNLREALGLPSTVEMSNTGGGR